MKKRFIIHIPGNISASQLSQKIAENLIIRFCINIINNQHNRFC